MSTLGSPPAALPLPVLQAFARKKGLDFANMNGAKQLLAELNRAHAPELAAGCIPASRLEVDFALDTAQADTRSLKETAAQDKTSVLERIKELEKKLTVGLAGIGLLKWLFTAIGTVAGVLIVLGGVAGYTQMREFQKYTADINAQSQTQQAIVDASRLLLAQERRFFVFKVQQTCEKAMQDLSVIHFPASGVLRELELDERMIAAILKRSDVDAFMTPNESKGDAVKSTADRDIASTDREILHFLQEMCKAFRLMRPASLLTSPRSDDRDKAVTDIRNEWERLRVPTVRSDPSYADFLRWAHAYRLNVLAMCEISQSRGMELRNNSLQKAERYAREAIAADPTFSRAQGTLATAIALQLYERTPASGSERDVWMRRSEDAIANFEDALKTADNELFKKRIYNNLATVKLLRAEAVMETNIDEAARIIDECLPLLDGPFTIDLPQAVATLTRVEVKLIKYKLGHLQGRKTSDDPKALKEQLLRLVKDSLTLGYQFSARNRAEFKADKQNKYLMIMIEPIGQNGPLCTEEEFFETCRIKD
jgi:hypothetical protein